MIFMEYNADILGLLNSLTILIIRIHVREGNPLYSLRMNIIIHSFVILEASSGKTKMTKYTLCAVLGFAVTGVLSTNPFETYMHAV